MKTSLADATPLPAKLTRPKAHLAFLRTRLFERLDSAREHPAIWITSPAGAGKTVLLSSYIEARKLTSLWYQIDEGDGDIASFFHYLAKAAQQFEPGSLPLLALTPEYLPGLSVFTRRFFEALYQRLPPPAVLVLDNYQETPANSRLHEILRIGSALLPTGINLVVLSRIGPPAELARLRAHGELTVIGFDELKLTLEEARGIAALRQAIVANPSKAGFVEECHAKTLGWTAGLVLMLEQKESRTASSLPSKEITQRLLFDYFAGEIFAGLPSDIQTFLMKTAVMSKMTPALAIELAENAGAERILTELHRRDFFILRREETEAIFEYHPLFRDFLLAYAKRVFSDQAYRELQRKAAEALRIAGQTEEAVSLFLEAQDWPSVISLLTQIATQLLIQGNHQTLKCWLDALPPRMLAQTPWLLYWRGMACLPSDPIEARGYFEQALTGFDNQNEPAGLYLAWASVVDTFQLENHDFRPLDPWIAAFECLHARYPEFPSPEIERRVHAMLVALYFRQPQHPKLSAWAEKGLSLLRTCSDAWQGVPLGANMLLYYIEQGNLLKAEWVIDELRRLSQTAAVLPHMHIFRCVWESIYFWIRGDHQTCLDRVAEGLEMSCNTGMHLWDPMLFANGVYGSLIAGATEIAEVFLRKLALAIKTLVDRSAYHQLSALLAQQRGQFTQALDHAQQALTISIESGIPFPQALNWAILALSRFEHGQDHEGTECLAEARAIGVAMSSPVVDYLCSLTEARTALSRGQETQGLESLKQALRLSREMHGYTFGWWGPAAMAQLYAKALEASIEIDYVQGLIRKGYLAPPDPAVAPELWPWPVKVYTLGAFTVLKNGEQLRFIGKSQQKPLELLMALIALGGLEVSQQRLADALWPDTEGDAAYRALITTLHRLRKLLDCPQAIHFREGRLSLGLQYVWVDANVFKQLLDEKNLIENAAASERVFTLYRGAFLAGIETPWAAARRDRLRVRYRSYILTYGQALENAGRGLEAVNLYQKAIEAEAALEAFHQRLIRCHLQQSQISEAREAYKRCRRILAVQFGRTPSRETEALIKPYL